MIKKILPLIILCTGIVITVNSAWNIFEMKLKGDQSLVVAKQLIERRESLAVKDVERVMEQDFLEQGETIGLLRFPTLDSELPIVQGTDSDDLEKGVGHYKGSFYPGDNGQIVLSGHRDTVFKELGKLKIGDEIKIQMPYGDYSYEISHTKIVDADDTSIITLQNKEEELILTTCYPFSFVGDAPERYIIYAKLKK